MMRFRPREILLPLGVFALGLGGGMWLAAERGGLHSAGRFEGRSVPSAESARPNTPEPRRRFASQEEMLTEVMSAVSENDELRQAHRLHEALGALDRGELRGLFQRVVKVENRDRREAALYAILASWAAVDPDGAVKAVRPFIDRLRGMGNSAWRAVESGVARAWAEAMPEAALAEAIRPPADVWAFEMAQIAVETLAGEPERQFEVITQVPEGQLRNNLCERAIAALAVKDFAAAEARLNLITDPWKRDVVHAGLFQRLAWTDPSAALERLVELGPNIPQNQHGSKMVAEVLEKAGKDNFTGAVAALDRLPEEVRASALDSALVGWGRIDPIAAMDWAAGHGMDITQIRSSVFFSPNGFASWTSLLLSAYYTDYAKTLEWVRAQPVSASRDEMLADGIWRGSFEQKTTIFASLSPLAQAEEIVRMVSDMQNDNPDRAASWVKGLPAGEARENAVQTLAAAGAAKSPDGLDSLADEWAAGPDRNAALTGIVNHLTEKDPQSALPFALRITDPSRREGALDSIFFTWERRNATAARAWLSGSSGFSSEHQRVLLRQVEDRAKETR